MKFYGIVGQNPRTNRLDFEWSWPKVKATGGLKVTPFKIVTESRHEKLKYSSQIHILAMIMAVELKYLIGGVTSPWNRL